MKILNTVRQAQEYVLQRRMQSHTVGLVPTMGALHDGHLSLVAMSRSRCDDSIATIFVNPTQFAPGEDLDKYPRTLERDLEKLTNAGCDAVFIPSTDEMYPPGSSTMVVPPKVALPLEGKFRPEHFRGVATVVLKLFQILPASHAFFGQKDFQQLRVIETMVDDLNVPIEIVSCPIVREADGLAMSSRNRYLNVDERQRSLCLSQALAEVEAAFKGGQREVKTLTEILHRHLPPAANTNTVDRVDYAVIVDSQSLKPIERIESSAVTLLAAHVGTTRLIDNCILRFE